ncbi:methylaspartate mutase [Amycolatopsis sp. WQ 127309]|uniref:methylaspartate mutase n=1 Tax=Amycolatopsis sp. WQ 127309 TaxID=2932773 RepID=UPI001FF2BBB3|nr:methylaspartate mutase [Amycolatopsis sp. WQ 127309]UOZ03015.1 methylaspartate mutase [Amycolatopsis sp. WQ 127309]
MSVPFGAFVAREHAAGRLVVQPRMGFPAPSAMRAGLLATRDAAATTVGTLTLDSYTRVGDLVAAARALADGAPLNGFPLVTYGPEATRAMLAGVLGPDFPVQVRHGSARPQDIVATLVAAGLDATEGGPVSYCLPYSRTPLRTAMRHWVAACAQLTAAGDTAHLETFGGCMLGQLCPPGMLVAISVLEAIFFAQQGIRSVSLSYAQQTDPAQDEEAVRALRLLAARYLPGVEWHVVLYAYMGVYPRTPAGAARLLTSAARLAVRSGAARLIVKTAAEAHRIPTVGENVDALELAARVAAATPLSKEVGDTGIHAEAATLVEAVLDLDDDLAGALPAAFARGLLDIPYCLHPDNAGRARSYLDPAGRLQWADTGGLPIGPAPGGTRSRRTGSAELLAALSHVERKFDTPPAVRAGARPGGAI